MEIPAEVLAETKNHAAVNVKTISYVAVAANFHSGFLFSVKVSGWVGRGRLVERWRGKTNFPHLIATNYALARGREREREKMLIIAPVLASAHIPRNGNNVFRYEFLPTTCRFKLLPGKLEFNILGVRT